MSPSAKHDNLDDRTLAVIELTAQRTAERVVKEHVATCPIVANFHSLHADFYGVPGKKDTHPGVFNDVADLKHSRNVLRNSLRAVWLAIVAIIGAIAGKLWS